MLTELDAELPAASVGDTAKMLEGIVAGMDISSRSEIRNGVAGALILIHHASEMLIEEYIVLSEKKGERR